MIDHFKKVDFPRIFQGKDVTQCWDVFKEVTKISLDRYIPLAPQRQLGELPWLTHAVKRITRRKKRLWKCFTGNRNDQNFAAYKVAEKKCKNIVQHAKKVLKKKIC